MESDTEGTQIVSLGVIRDLYSTLEVQVTWCLSVTWLKPLPLLWLAVMVEQPREMTH